MSGRLISLHLLYPLEHLVDTSLCYTDRTVIRNLTICYLILSTSNVKTLHCVGLSGTCLTIGENSTVITLNKDISKSN